MPDLVPPALLPADAASDDVVYVLDVYLRVAYVNEPWIEFARANGGESLLREEWDCDAIAAFTGSSKWRWQGIYSALLSGQMQSHEEDFICPSPVERRDFHLRITVHRDPATGRALLVHPTARTRASVPPREVRPPAAVIRGTEVPRTTVRSEYQRQVLDRAVLPAHCVAAQSVVPLEEVGGDLLWHRVRGDGSTDIVLADVMGHGMAAARLAVTITTLLDRLADETDQASKIVSLLNRELCALRQPGDAPTFATGLFLRVDPHERTLDVCSFAHEGPVFSRAGRIDVSGGLPIGIVAEGGPWPIRQFRFATVGTRFLVCSDGVTEQFDPAGEMFGVRRLEDCFLQALGIPLPEVISALSDEVETFRSSALVKDDRTFLAIEAPA